MNAPKVRRKSIRIFQCKDGKYSLFVTDTKRAYTIGEAEKQILDLLDGKNTLEAIEGSGIISHTDLYDLVDMFRDSGFLEDSKPHVKKNILKLKFGIFCPNAFLNNHPHVVSCLNFIICYLSLPIFLVSLFLNIKDIRILSLANIREYINMSTFLIFSISSFFALLLHELSHAMVAKRNGANIAEIGIMLYAFLPCAYCTICSMGNITSLHKRCSVYLAGINCNLLISGLVFLIHALTPEAFPERYTIPLVFTNLIPVLINFIFFMKYDGYFLVSDVLQEPFLRENSFHYIKIAITSPHSNIKASSAQKMIYGIYGCLSLVYLSLLPFVMVISLFIE